MTIWVKRPLTSLCVCQNLRRLCGAFSFVTLLDLGRIPGAGMAIFFKATLAIKKANEHGLSNAMEARLYL